MQEAFHLHEYRELKQRVVIRLIERHLEHVVRERVLLPTNGPIYAPRDGRREMAAEIGARACATSSFSHAHFSRRSARSSSCLLSERTRFDSLRTSRAPSNAMCTGLAHRVQKSRACVGSFQSRLRRFMVALVTMTIMMAIMMAMAIVEDSPCCRRRR